MTDKHDPKPAPVEYAVVDDQYLLPLEEAVTLLRMLSRCMVVQRNYGGSDTVPFKPSPHSRGQHTLTTVTTAQHAAIHLEGKG